MPIRPENRDRYPKDWPEISRRIRFERAGYLCECRGECGHDHTRDDGAMAHERLMWVEPGRCTAIHGEPHPRTGSRVVLTVAHLNHTPEDCRPENLRAMCQGCHLHYDLEHHAQTRQRARTAALEAQMNPLFGPEILGCEGGAERAAV